MTQEEKRIIDFILEMPRFDFQMKVLRGIASNRAFGALVTFGASSLDTAERMMIQEALCKIDCVFTKNLSDYALEELATVVADRSIRIS